jgi:glutaredoxin 3
MPEDSGGGDVGKDAPAVVMYTRGFCGYCSAARKLLKVKGVDFADLDTTLNAKLRREMMGRSGRQTVPQIFIGDHHVGGYDDLAALEKAGKLNELLGLED